ncbi:RHS repeat-associated core domain-containing protein [Peribacillus loiseleuriae]|uniref:RHS repeat-associated core domain-containing protein n=1 Tax=Peribacillus loiseleuriae TaxID=1679170 RepID=UPI0009E3232C
MYDEETGFYYLKSRYYNPEIGRFITRDIVADSNMYLYADNNPVNFVDHDGAFIFPIILFSLRFA